MQGFGNIAEFLRRSTVSVSTAGGSGGGSGVVWDTGGLVVTNAHVARGRPATVRFWDGTTAEATLVRNSPGRDLAALRVATPCACAVNVRDSGSIRPGELAIAIGNPLGFQGALSTGVVHAVGRVRGLGGRPWIVADVRVLPGNSGGPLADAEGRLIGINTMLAGGMALAIPSNDVVRFLRARQVRLGVEVRPVRVDGRRLGLLILSVEPDSPADLASLLPGDTLIRASGEPFQSPDDLSLAMEQASDGLVHLEFLRGGVVHSTGAALHAARAEAA